eukprot:m.257943 g.257943  ORF g.257943 m.257943 type:complete len:626 (-) comp35923_c0_seq1:543-2420(-)
MSAKKTSNLFQNADKRQVLAASTTVDEDGQQRSFDIREDEEQQTKLDEIIQLLLAAGYFRARIKGLSAFDKIVGGMVWCITASNEDVDVDILFEENSTIGQKIALTEKIVSALPRLKCPLRLEPHQIQGLDNASIYPVVQWLVKRALETREEMMVEQRNSALFEFNKFGITPDDATFEAALPTSTTTVRDVQTMYGAARILKAPDVAGADAETLIQCTLLEYGRRYGAGKIPKGKKDKKQKEGGESQEDLIAREEKRVKAILKKMSSLEDVGVSSAKLNSITGMQNSEIKELSEEFAKQAALLNATQEGKEGGIAAHNRAVANLEKQFEVSTTKIESAQEKHDQLVATTAEWEAKLAKATKIKGKIDKAMGKMDDLEADEANKEVLAKLRHLVALNEKIKTQEADFKATCQSEMESLEAKIEKLEGSGVEIMDDDRTRAIAEQYAADQAKMEKLKRLVARRTRQISTLQRQIDEYPGRGELNQYQRRFVELYAAINTKLRETKQYYTLYNTLDDTKLYLSKEVKLLESIGENYTAAMGSAAGKEQLLKQMEVIVEALTKNKGKVDDRIEKEGSTRDELSTTLKSLLDNGRNYFKCVKDYELACQKNEEFTSRLERRQSKRSQSQA